jgi:hypothetical protein
MPTPVPTTLRKKAVMNPIGAPAYHPIYPPTVAPIPMKSFSVIPPRGTFWRTTGERSG